MRQSLRDGRFVTGERLRLIPAAFLIAYAAALIGLALTAHGLSDFKGRPLGTDFSDVYAAGRLAVAGHAADAYVPALHAAAERGLFGAATPFYGWHYPPFFFLIAAPLGRLGYLPALALWQAASLALFLAAMAALIRRTPARLHRGETLLLLLAFPAVFVNLIHGQNGFLTAGLLAAALAFLDERPLLAGLCFGLLVYKPQFGIMIPLVLGATGRWRSFASATATVAGLSVLVTVLFGPGIWSAFLASSHFTRTVILEQGATGFWKIQSVFAAVRLWGGSIALAYALQGLVTLATAVLLVRLWRSRANSAHKGAALAIGAILATPYSLDYDMMALAPAIALLACDGLAHGFAPWRKSALAALWLVPAVARNAAHLCLLPLGLLAMLTVFGLVTLDTRATERERAPVPQRL